MRYFYTPNNDIRAIELGQEFLIQNDWVEIDSPKPSPHHYLDSNYNWVEDTSAAKQAARNSLANKAQQELDKGFDPQFNEYNRDVKLGKTPSADSTPYSYTARDGTVYEGEQALLHWGDDLRQIIRDANDGILDPNESIPNRPS